IGGEYVHANLTREHIAAELLAWKSKGFYNESIVNAFIDDCLESYRDALDKVALSSKAYPRLRETIASFIVCLLSGKPAGKLC
ncbi:MAG: hypothetical protein FWD43_06015, partial [Coriobacteriia bacterium]|nr:hypothetical protein [Coriobacteriia bacterium]